MILRRFDIFRNYVKPIATTLFVAIGLFFFASCGDDEISTDPMDRLAFSVEKVDFDTIIAGQPSNTYYFMVYNRAKKDVQIDRIYLQSGSNANFKVNVDGISLVGGSATDFLIPAEDSMRVFLFANVPDADSDAPIPVSDALVFQLSTGITQQVPLNAQSQSVVKLKGKRISGTETFTPNRPYQIVDSLVVEAGATLNIQAGAKLLFGANASLIVHGTLNAVGTFDAPIVFRGDRLGEMFSNQPYDRIPAQWVGIRFAGDSYGNRIYCCDIHSAQNGVVCDSSNVDVLKLSMENSILHNMSKNCLGLRMSQVFVGNSQITNAGGNCVDIRGGRYQFVHCTIANFYAFTGGRGVALVYTNQGENNERLPLYQCDFINCLVTGYSADEIMGSASERYTDDAFAYTFRNCLLNTPEVEGEGIINCFWDRKSNEVYRDKNFEPEFDLDQLIFTFFLSEKSQAVNNADHSQPSYTYTHDLLGRMRDGNPDIGCYEFFPANE